MFSILHLDKSALIRQMVKSTLEGRGFDYISIENANDAYKIIDDKKLDLIVTSMYIDGDSIENFMAHVNKGINKGTPVYVVTGSDLDEVKKRVVNLGISDYIHKDNIITEMSKHVDIILKQFELMEFLKESTIAVIDDSRLDLGVIKNIMESHGIYKVDCYSSDSDLIRSGKQYDMYLIDAILKEGYGSNLVMQIRRNNIDASIIIVSSITNPKTIAGFLSSGADDFIYKPVDEDIFIAKLRANIRHHVVLKKLKLTKSLNNSTKEDVKNLVYE